MATYTLRGRITDDHRLEVELPTDAPPGEAEIVVTVDDPNQSNSRALIALFKQWESEPLQRTARTREEIDAQLNEMRDDGTATADWLSTWTAAFSSIELRKSHHGPDASQIRLRKCTTSKSSFRTWCDSNAVFFHFVTMTKSCFSDLMRHSKRWSSSRLHPLSSTSQPNSAHALASKRLRPSILLQPSPTGAMSSGRMTIDYTRQPALE